MKERETEGEQGEGRLGIGRCEGAIEAGGCCKAGNGRKGSSVIHFGPIKRTDRDETVLLTLITFSSSVVTVICGRFRMRKEDDDLDSMVLATLRHSHRDTHTFALTHTTLPA